MAFNKPLFDIDQAGLQFEVNSYEAGFGLNWKKLFPTKYTSKFDLKGLEGNEGIPVSADKVAFDAKAPKKSRKKIGSWSGELGKIAISRDKNEIEINEYNDAKAVSFANPEDKAAADQLIAIVYDDVKFCADGLDARLEVDALRIACNGKMVYSEKIDGDTATQDVIDFNIPSNNFRGASAAWATYASGEWTANSNADALKDIVEASKAIVKAGGKKPKYCYMSDTAFEWVCAMSATAHKLYPTAAAGTVSSDAISLTSVNSYLKGKGYPEIVPIDARVTIQHKDGSEEVVEPWDAHKVVLSPSENLGRTYYKPVPMIQNVAALQAQGEYYKMTRYSDLNPMLEVTMAEAYVQPALENRKSLVYINAAKTSWSNGDR